MAKWSRTVWADTPQSRAIAARLTSSPSDSAAASRKPEKTARLPRIQVPPAGAPAGAPDRAKALAGNSGPDGLGFDPVRPPDAEEALRDRLARRCALVVIDVQCGFTDEDGSFARFGNDTAPLREVLPRISGLLGQARRARIPIVHVRSEGRAWLNWPANVAPPRMIAGARRAPAGTRMLEPGTREVEFALGAEPQPGEIVITKHVFDAFLGTPLDWTLHRAAVETVICAGLTTEGCVESTARSALGHGYAAIVVEDAVASSDAELHEASLRVVGEVIGIVATRDEIARAGRWPT